jgi:hypothetical protein
VVAATAAADFVVAGEIAGGGGFGLNADEEEGGGGFLSLNADDGDFLTFDADGRGDFLTAPAPVAGDFFTATLESTGYDFLLTLGPDICFKERLMKLVWGGVGTFCTPTSRGLPEELTVPFFSFFKRSRNSLSAFILINFVSFGLYSTRFLCLFLLLLGAFHSNPMASSLRARSGMSFPSRYRERWMCAHRPISLSVLGTLAVPWVRINNRSLSKFSSHANCCMFQQNPISFNRSIRRSESDDGLNSPSGPFTSPQYKRY